ncbi:Bax inhibitor-1/YccA family protein [Acidiphilium sp. AL]|uniref:Bax inhibitor-1/YccA family protein n=1 Tax=Acidiphilium sp. AL TaxID=2871704 RepID=UPI0021CB8166|nr:Bax inhibitor-1/YccA family protein [Acidiphilium sp. AL]MCU4159106.1 Bax inhibitor-1/YccA family protein [Acidiphilium sp. AL]
MAIGPDMRSYRGASVAAGAGVLDEGLRAYMLRVYNWMASGLLLTAIISYAISHTGAIDLFYPLVTTASGAVVRQPGILAYITIFAPLGFMLVMSFGVNKLSTTQAQALFWAFCATMGASLTNIFLVYTGRSILTTFFVTAATFGAMSLYGYTTKANLAKLGSFLIMGVIGLLIAMVVNIFLQSSAFQFAISAIGVLIFTGLAAYQTQQIKADYLQYGYRFGADIASKRSVYDALQLYLTFINLFMFLLQFMGNRRS